MGNPELRKTEPVQELDVEKALLTPAEEAFENFNKVLDDEFAGTEKILSPTEVQAIRSNIEGMFRQAKKDVNAENAQEKLDTILEEARKQINEKSVSATNQEQAASTTRQSEAVKKLEGVEIPNIETTSEEPVKPVETKKPWYKKLFGG